MDIEKMFEAACAALGISKDSSPSDLKAAIDAAANAKDAQQKLADIQAGKKAEPEEAPPPEEPEAEAEMASVPSLSATPKAAKALSDTAPQAPSDAAKLALADSPEAVDAAAKAAFEKLSVATGLDAAGVLAFVSDNLEKIAALAGVQPESGQPSDKPADAAPEMSAPAVAASAEKAADDARRLALEAELQAERDRVAKLSAELESKQKHETELAVNAVVEEAIATGVALAAERESLRELAIAGGVDRMRKYLSARKPAVPTKRLMAGTEPGTERSNVVQLTDAQSYAFKSFKAAGIDEERARALAVNPPSR